MANSLNSYQAVEQYLNSLTLYSSLRLDRIQKLLGLLGNPQKNFESIVVGGTAGKGSTTTILAAVLKAAGFKVGLFTSPHLEKINERFVINGKQISDKELIKLINKLSLVIPSGTLQSGVKSRNLERFNARFRSLDSSSPSAPQNDNIPSYFEILTAIAFQWFASKKVDVAVLEVGMGGRFDATNVVDNKVAILTNVHLDHMKFLGNTVAKIAREKVAIVKEKGILITSVSQPGVIKVVNDYTKTKAAKVIFVDKNSYKIKKSTTAKTVFDLKTPKRNYRNIELSLLGQHQATNAALAVTAAQIFCPTISSTAVWEGLKKAFIPGRLEIIKLSKAGGTRRRTSMAGVPAVGGHEGKRGTGPAFAAKAWADNAGLWRKSTIILDGAHNPVKMQALVQTLTRLWPGRKFITIFAAKKDKDIKKMLQSVLPLTCKLIITKFERTTDFGKSLAVVPKTIAKLAQTISHQTPIIVPDNQKALSMARKLAKKDDLVLVTGSLYLVGEVRKLISD
jgi:dihydrofolate synthase/folylpolyglutamate synthase